MERREQSSRGAAWVPRPGSYEEAVLTWFEQLERAFQKYEAGGRTGTRRDLKPPASAPRPAGESA